MAGEIAFGFSKVTKRADKFNGSLQVGTFTSKWIRAVKDSNNFENKFKSKCYNCGDEGHTYLK